MRPKKALLISVFLIFGISFGTALNSDLQGIDHDNPALNESIVFNEDKNELTMRVVISGDSVLGYNVDSGDKIIVGEFKVNDTYDNSYTHHGKSSPSLSRDDFTITTESYNDDTNYSGYEAEWGSDVPVGSDVVFTAKVNKSTLEDNNISVYDARLYFNSLWQFNNDGELGTLDNWEITEFNVVDSQWKTVISIIITILPVLVIIVLVRDLKDMN